MKYKVGDNFLIPVEVNSIDESRAAPYFLSGCADCKHKGKRHQKCSCCIRNRNMKDCYESEE